MHARDRSESGLRVRLSPAVVAGCGPSCSGLCRPCGVNPVGVAEELAGATATACMARRRGGTYEEIILIDLSLRALLIRKMLVFAMGEAICAAPCTRHPPGWADCAIRAHAFMALVAVSLGTSLSKRVSA